MAGYLINRTLPKLLKGKSLFELFQNKSPSYSQIKNFSCLTLAHDHNLPKDKFRACSHPYIFRGIHLG